MAFARLHGANSSDGYSDWQISQQWSGAYNIAPDCFMPKYSDGSWGYQPGATNVTNSAQQLALGGTRESTTTRITTDFVLEQKLDFITKGLSAHVGMISWDNTFLDRNRGINDMNNQPQLKWIDPETGDVSYYKAYEDYDKFDYTVGNKWTMSGGRSTTGLLSAISIISSSSTGHASLANTVLLPWVFLAVRSMQRVL